MMKNTVMLMPVALALCFTSCGRNYGNRETAESIGVTSAKLENGMLELDGRTPNGALTIAIDGCNNVALADCQCPTGMTCFTDAQSNGAGEFSIRLANFSSPTCWVSISDGRLTEVVQLTACLALPNAPQPPQTPTTPPPNGPNTPIQPPTDMPNALRLVQQADTQIRTLSGKVQGYATAMEAAAAQFEEDIATAASNESLPALEMAVKDALMALEYADAAGIAGDQIARNLGLIATAVTDAAGFLTAAGPSGEGPSASTAAERMMALAQDAEARADEAGAALQAADEGIQALAEELEDAAEVAEDLGAEVRAAQLEAEGLQAVAVTTLLEGAIAAIEAFEAAISDGAIPALETAQGAR